MTVGIALLGAGRIGKVHASAIAGNRNARLVAVADSVAEAAQAIANRHGCKVASIDAIEPDTAVDAVVICTPTDTHSELIERFARAGKAVFCEKPIDLDIERVDACLKVVAETRETLMVGFNRRFDPHFMALSETVRQGRIGAIEQVVITSRDPGPPPIDYVTRSGGIFRDMTIHDFDMARVLLGAEPVSVSATASVLVDKAIGEAGDHDTAVAVLTTNDGRQCVIVNSRRATYGYDQRIEVLGSKGMVSAENQRPVSIEIATDEGFSRPPLHDFFMTRYTDAYANEIGAFVAAVATGTKAFPDGEDGRRALALADAAMLSVAQGRRVDVSEVM
jgi:myo-inositol 2-dehydrogenase / D-chiro-inositol 1-dehydrogenase